MKESFENKSPAKITPKVVDESEPAEESFPNYRVAAAATGAVLAFGVGAEGVEAKEVQKTVNSNTIESRQSYEARAEGVIGEVVKIEERFGDARDRQKIRTLVQTKVDVFIAQYPGSREAAVQLLGAEVQKTAARNPLLTRVYAFTVLQAMTVPRTPGQIEREAGRFDTAPPAKGEQPSERRVNRMKEW